MLFYNCALTSVQTWPPAGEQPGERHIGACGVWSGSRHDGSVDIGRTAAGVSAGRFAVAGGWCSREKAYALGRNTNRSFFYLVI